MKIYAFSAPFFCKTQIGELTTNQHMLHIYMLIGKGLCNEVIYYFSQKVNLQDFGHFLLNSMTFPCWKK